MSFFGLGDGTESIAAPTVALDANETLLIDDVRVAVESTVPEPTTWTPLGAGLVALAGVARRRRTR